MLPRKYRLQDYQEIEKVKKEGKLYQTPLFGFLILPRNDQNSSRFAFIVSLKIHKKSTKRNRVKRLLSEAVWGLLPKIKPGFDIVFLGKKTLIGKSKNQTEKEIKKAFKENGLILDW